jgi:NAD(P)-dependent dehydrogenase (short-subunit alcohol dehydrogenase family)
MQRMEDDIRLLVEPPTLRLDGKACWLTGASRGLGRAMAFALAGAGAEVLLMARDTDRLSDVANAIRDAGGVVHVAAGSVADDSDVRTAAALAERAWGRIDVLVNNAGISPSFRRAEEVDPDDWQRVLDVNLTGAFRCCRAAIPLLEAAGGGAMVNVSSVHGSAGHERLSAYAASKGGLELLTRSLALETAGRNIRVNALAPGYLETDMTRDLRAHDRWRAHLLDKIPMGRFARPEELVGAMLLLAGPASAYMTGATVHVDGGWMAQ